MPPSTPTPEEYKAIEEALIEARERVRGNKKEAIRILHAAGIVTKKGKLTAPYRP
jgi:hypothetical protein